MINCVSIGSIFIINHIIENGQRLGLEEGFEFQNYVLMT